MFGLMSVTSVWIKECLDLRVFGLMSVWINDCVILGWIITACGRLEMHVCVIVNSHMLSCDIFCL